MTTLQDKLDFCQLVEPDKDFGIVKFSNNEIFLYKDYLRREGYGDKVTNEYLESLCMRWLIENQEKLTHVDGLRFPVSKYFCTVRRLSIDSIIKLALEMNK